MLFLPKWRRVSVRVLLALLTQAPAKSLEKRRQELEKDVNDLRNKFRYAAPLVSVALIAPPSSQGDLIKPEMDALKAKLQGVCCRDMIHSA